MIINHIIWLKYVFHLTIKLMSIVKVWIFKRIFAAIN